MKKIYLFFITVLTTVTTANAQSIHVSKTVGGTTINDNDVLYVSVATNNLGETDFDFKNISGSAKSYKVTRTNVLLNKPRTIDFNDTAYAYFCTGINCYPLSASGSITPNPVNLNPNASESLKTYLQEASTEGVSTIKYEIYDMNNTSDKFTFTISYNNPLSVKNNGNLFSYVSDVFPNPANSRAQFIVNSTSPSINNTLIITNALGAVVSTKVVALNAGKNAVLIDAENLPNGIYFATLTNGNSKVVKKFTIIQ